MNEPLSFHAWKIEQIRKDSFWAGIEFFRTREWYWEAYGKYCTAVRNGKHWEAAPPDLSKH